MLGGGKRFFLCAIGLGFAGGYLLTDVGLTHINGRQLAEIARARRPGLKVLFITGYAEKAMSRSNFLESGMEILAKPFALDALAAKIRDLLTGIPDVRNL